jgi:ABC-type polar amino acid transport system ATPase subunit
MTPARPIVEARAIHKHFGALHVLRGVDFSVEERQLVFVIGPSGSGKSTLLRCLNRLEEPSSGSIIVDGIDMLDARTDINKARQKIGMVFQSFNLYPHMTALGNVMLALRKVQGLDKAEAEARAQRALERVHLADRADHYPSQLSGGQQQRVAIARALVNHPPLLFADEPTGNLDSHTSVDILRMFKQLNEADGITIIMVTHDAEVARHARRIIHIHDGVIVNGEQTHTPEAGFVGTAPGSGDTV